MEKEKKKKLIKGIALVCIACLIVVLIPVLSEEKTVYGATCPGKNSPSVYVPKPKWGCGCARCGGTIHRPAEGDKVEYYDFPLEDRGTGIDKETITKTEYGVKWRIYYRCYNCGVSKRYSEEVYRIAIEVIDEAEAREEGLSGDQLYSGEKVTKYKNGRGAGCGYVPWHFCTFCEKWGDGSPQHNTCYQLNTAVAPAGSGTIDISCSDPAKIKGKIVAPNATVTLKAVAKEGYEFSKWSTGETKESIDIMMTGSGYTKTVTATFVKKATPTPIEPTVDPDPGTKPPVTEPPKVTEAPKPTDPPPPPPHEHDFGAWVYDKNKHWKECTSCDEQGESGAHNFTSETDTVSGTVTKTCTDCGYSYNYHSHKWSGWYYDAEYHWQECEYCDSLKSYGEHRWSAWYDVMGGKRRECPVCLLSEFKGFVYTLTFDKNHPEATGGMAPQTHTFGETRAISKNLFRNELSVTYDMNTGLADDPATITHNANSRAAAREFVGWALSPDGGPRFLDGQEVNNLSMTDGETIPLYAYWGGASVTLPQIEWPGHFFLGWQWEDDPELYYSGDVVEVSAPGTFTAQWEPVFYNVAFEANGGTPCTNIRVETGKPYGTLPTTTRDGYAFGGWRIQGTVEFVTAETKVTLEKDHVLEAVWTGIPYTVTFDYNFNYNAAADNPVKNGSDTKTVYYTETYGALPVPARDGYTFIGWCTEEAGGNGSGQLVTSATEVFTNWNHTLYARWEVNGYTLNFDYNYDFSVWD